MAHSNNEKHFEALRHFKDWSNYLLVSTVASLGWVATRQNELTDSMYLVSILAFSVSIVFAIFTLALIPLIAQNIEEHCTSFYDVKPTFRPFPPIPRRQWTKIKTFCFPQHVLFLIGIAAYTYGSVEKKFGPLF